jgi:hypothetical protein
VNILDDVHPALGYVLEEKAETDLLLLHGVSAVVEDDVEVRAVRLDERPQLLAAGRSATPVVVRSVSWADASSMSTP